MGIPSLQTRTEDNETRVLSVLQKLDQLVLLFVSKRTSLINIKNVCITMNWKRISVVTNTSLRHDYKYRSRLWSNDGVIFSYHLNLRIRRAVILVLLTNAWIHKRYFGVLRNTEIDLDQTLKQTKLSCRLFKSVNLKKMSYLKWTMWGPLGTQLKRNIPTKYVITPTDRFTLSFNELVNLNQNVWVKISDFGYCEKMLIVYINIGWRLCVHVFLVNRVTSVHDAWICPHSG